MRGIFSRMINKKGIIIMTSFAIVYAILELGMRWDPVTVDNSPLWMRELFTPEVSLYTYRAIYTLIFLFPSYLSSGKLISAGTLWYLIYGSTLEDIFYWILDLRLPYSWAWFYPVIKGIPVDDIISTVVLVILYKLITVGRKKEKLH